jgi:hypothetical protein
MELYKLCRQPLFKDTKESNTVTEDKSFRRSNREHPSFNQSIRSSRSNNNICKISRYVMSKLSTESACFVMVDGDHVSRQHSQTTLHTGQSPDRQSTCKIKIRSNVFLISYLRRMDQNGRIYLFVPNVAAVSIERGARCTIPDGII